MGILTRPLLRPQQRFDLEDYNVALSALRADSHFYTQRVIASKAYILQGFTISNAFIGQPTADVSMTNATLINGNNTGDVSWWTAPASPSPLTLPTGVGGLLSGRNYVELEVYSQDGTPLQRAFWDPSADSGKGVEFTQEVNTVTEMFIRVHVNQSAFTVGNPNYIALAVIDLDGSLNIKGIKDKREKFYRLGKPGNIDQRFPWASRKEPGTSFVFTVSAGTPFLVDETVTIGGSVTGRVQTGGTNNVVVFDFSSDAFAPGDVMVGSTSGASATVQSYYESFIGADKDITTTRDMYMALMTEIAAVKGTRFWYEIGNAASLPSLLDYLNVLVAPISAGARYAWTGSLFKITDNKVSGQATSDVIAALRVPGYGGNLYLTREDGTGGSAGIAIPDKSVLYVDMPNPLGTSRSYSESGPGSTNFKVIDIALFVPTDHKYIIAYREGTKIVVPGMGELKAGEEVDIGNGVSKEILAFIGAEDDTSTQPQYTTTPSADVSNAFSSNDSLTQAISQNAANVNDIAQVILRPYQEQLLVVTGSPASDNEVQAPKLSGATITLPADSRNSDAVRTYKVGQGGLFVDLNGQAMIVGVDYSEIGSIGTLSSTIQILRDLTVDDMLEFRIINPQFIGASGSAQPFFVNYITGQNGSAVASGSLFNSGTDKLQVWRDGLCMNKTVSVGDLIDRYTETNNSSLAVAEAANPDEVFVMVNQISPAPAITLMTGLTGTVLTVPTYVIGNGSMRVFRNGILLTTQSGAPVDLKYTETSTTSITLSMAALSSDVFKIYIGNVPSFRTSLTGSTATVVTIPGGNLYTLGNKHLLVFRNGLLMLNSISLGTAAERYQETSTSQITLETALVSTDVLEFIKV